MNTELIMVVLRSGQYKAVPCFCIGLGLLHLTSVQVLVHGLGFAFGCELNVQSFNELLVSINDCLFSLWCRRPQGLAERCFPLFTVLYSCPLVCMASLSFNWPWGGS